MYPHRLHRIHTRRYTMSSVEPDQEELEMMAVERKATAGGWSKAVKKKVLADIFKKYHPGISTSPIKGARGGADGGMWYGQLSGHLFR